MHATTHQREVTSPVTNRRRSLLDWFDPGEPHPSRGPFARWPRVTDAALALVIFAGTLVAVALSALGDGEDFTVDSIGGLPPGAFVMLATAAAALLWRRQRPIAVTAFLLAIMIGWAIAGYGDGQDLAVIAAIYAVGRYTTEYRHSLTTVAAVIAVGILGTLIDVHQRVDIAPAVIFGWLP